MTLFSIILYIYWQCLIVTQQLLFFMFIDSVLLWHNVFHVRLTVSCCKNVFHVHLTVFCRYNVFHVHLTVSCCYNVFHVHLTVSYCDTTVFKKIRSALTMLNCTSFFMFTMFFLFTMSYCDIFMFTDINDSPIVTHILCSLTVSYCDNIFMFTDSPIVTHLLLLLLSRRILLWHIFYAHWQCPLVTAFLCLLTVSYCDHTQKCLSTL